MLLTKRAPNFQTDGEAARTTPRVRIVDRLGQVLYGDAGDANTTFGVDDTRQYQWLLKASLYSAAMAYIRGEFDIAGDLAGAIRFKKRITRTRTRDRLTSVLARVATIRPHLWTEGRSKTAQHIRFHYDRSNDFYRSFLDSRMVYSCAYFDQPGRTLDGAQTAKLRHICRKLDIRAGESFLDIGSGWGALVMLAAEEFGARATGCTLSLEQEMFARQEVERRNLSDRVTIDDCDYRDLSGRYDKIASVGMFEHVGRARLGGYFRKVHDLLTPDGLFLNHGIIRPECVEPGPETRFLQRRVFPGGELETLATVVRVAECAGFEILDVENLRPHYALTCKRWVENLQQNAGECLRQVTPATYRTWLLYLAGSAMSFEDGETDVYQILMAKRQPGPRRRLTREYMYR